MSDHQRAVEALVFGASPEGLATAAFLARAGVRVEVADPRPRSAVPSWPIVLGPSAIKVWNDLNLWPLVPGSICWIDRLRLHGPGASGVLEAADGEPLWASVDEASLVTAGTRALAEQHVKTRWQTRLKHLSCEPAHCNVSLEELDSVGLGYAVSESEQVVRRTTLELAEAVVGADGEGSRVRGALQLAYENRGKPRAYALFDFECDGDAPEEAHVILSDTRGDALWPLPGNSCRLLCELTENDERDGLEFSRDTPAHPLRLGSSDLQLLDKLLSERAPWFRVSPRRVQRAAAIELQPGMAPLAPAPEAGRTALLGAAGQLTGPADLFGFNAGLLEAEALASRIVSTLHGELGALQQFNRESYANRRGRDTIVDSELERDLPDLDRALALQLAKLAPLERDAERGRRLNWLPTQ